MVVRLYGWWRQRQRIHQRWHVHVGRRRARPEYNILVAVVVVVVVDDVAVDAVVAIVTIVVVVVVLLLTVVRG